MIQNYTIKFFSDRRISYFRKCLFAVGLLWSGLQGLQAQVSAYTFAQSTGTFNPVTAGTILETATGTTGTSSLYQVTPYNVTLPFDFNFNGKVYNNFKVSSNGFITFGSTSPSNTSSSPISSTDAYEGAIAVFGKSLNTFANLGGVTGDIRTEVVGTAPNREMVIQWTNFRPGYSTSTSSAYAFSFQIRLRETTNVINMVYNSGAFVIGSTNVLGSVQIGLRGLTNSDYNNRMNSSSVSFVSSTQGTSETSTQYTSTSSTSASGMPPAGFTYTWTPPNCFVPAFTTSSSTANSITANWTAPTPAPGSYDVYYSTNNAAPISTTTPTHPNIATTSVTIGSLNPSTIYYVWIRSNCGPGNVSAWSVVPVVKTTLCQSPALLSTNGTVICPGNTATLTATADAGAVINWYDASTNGTLLGTGNSFTTPILNSTTNYWTGAANVGVAKSVGPLTPESLGASSNTNTAWNLLFTVKSNLRLNSVDVFSGTAGQAGSIEILDVGGAVIATVPFTTTGAGNAIPQTVPLNILLPVGNYSMKRTGAANLYRNSAGATFPYTTTELDITGTTFSSYPTYYFYFYNLNFTPICESPRQQVTATVDAAGCLSTSEVDVKENFKVYPNPFTDFVNISNVEKVKSVRVMDVSGRIVKTIEKVSENINLSELKSGMYLLNLELKDGSKVSYKIIKK